MARNIAMYQVGEVAAMISVSKSSNRLQLSKGQDVKILTDRSGIVKAKFMCPIPWKDEYLVRCKGKLMSVHRDIIVLH